MGGQSDRVLVRSSRMEQQMSFAQSEYAGKKKVTRRERFLAEMEELVPWLRLVEVIKPHYCRKAGSKN